MTVNQIETTLDPARQQIAVVAIAVSLVGTFGQVLCAQSAGHYNGGDDL